jgi:hypothetical protein
MGNKKQNKKDYYDDLNLMFGHSGWKSWMKAVQEDYDKLSRLVTLDLVKEAQIAPYKDICRAYDILLHLDEETAREMRSVANNAKSIKKSTYK